MPIPTNNANNSFPQNGQEEVTRIYKNTQKPEQVSSSGDAVVSGVVGVGTQGKDVESTEKPVTTVQNEQVKDVYETEPTPVQQKTQTTVKKEEKTPSTSPSTTKEQKFNEFEQNRINYQKNKSDITKQISDEVAGELKSLGERGMKLDDTTKNQILARVMQNFKDQIPSEELAGAMKGINDSVLGLQTVGSWDEVYEKFNKSFKSANNLRNTDSNELARGLSSGLVTDSQMDSLKNIDPAKYDEVYAIKNDINKATTRNNILNDEVTPQKDVEKTSAENYFTREGEDQKKYENIVGGKGSLLNIYDSMVNTDGVAQMEGEISGLSTKITKLEREKNQMAETIEEEYATSLSKSALSALIRDRQEPLNEELINLRLDLDGKVGSLNSVKAENEKRFGIVMEEKKMKADEDWKRVQRDYKVAMDKYSMNREMSNDEWNKYKDTIQMKRTAEDRDYINMKPTQDQVLASLEGENGALLASKMSKLELEGGLPVYSFMSENGDIKIYSKDSDGTIKIVDTYIPLTPEQKEQKMTMINYMESRIGTEYERGGQSPTGGVDCSGLILLSGMASGAIPEGTDMTAQGMYNKTAKERDLNSLQEGDLVYFRGPDGRISHVASAMGSLKDGTLQVIDASGDKGVSIRNLKISDDGKRQGSEGEYQIIGKENFMIAQGTQTVEQDIDGLSDTAKNIMFGMDLKDLGQSERDPAVTEIRTYFESIKQQYTDDLLYKIDSSIINSKEITDSPKQKLMSINNVRTQLDNLESSLNSVDTGPLVGLLEKNIDKRTNQDTAALRAQLIAIVPDLARGVFGEKGVLTDTDIERYKQTIPDLTNRQDINTVITENLRNILRDSFINTISVEAKGGTNVSRFSDDYEYWKSSGGTQDIYSSFVNTKPDIDTALDEILD